LLAAVAAVELPMAAVVEVVEVSEPTSQEFTRHHSLVAQ